MPFTKPCSSPRGSKRNKDACDLLSSTTFYARRIITPEIADLRCQELDEEVLFCSLVALLGLQECISQAENLEGWIRRDIHYFVAHDFDFGLAYAAARMAWMNFEHYSDDDNISIQRWRWNARAQWLHEARSEAIQIDSGTGQALIESPYSIMPRRVWDLKSNRVVEFQMIHAAFQSLHSKVSLSFGLFRIVGTKICIE